MIYLLNGIISVHRFWVQRSGLSNHSKAKPFSSDPIQRAGFSLLNKTWFTWVTIIGFVIADLLFTIRKPIKNSLITREEPKNISFNNVKILKSWRTNLIRCYQTI